MSLRQATGFSPASIQTGKWGTAWPAHVAEAFGAAGHFPRQAGFCKAFPSSVAAGIRVDHTSSHDQTHHIEHLSGAQPTWQCLDVITYQAVVS